MERERLEILNCLNGDGRAEMIKEVRRGMAHPEKRLPSKYFYDERGSQLFERICLTPEYYPTSIELSILERSAGEIMEFFSCEGGDLVELGSGSNRKIRKLLDAARPFRRGWIRYVPVDISPASLLDSANQLYKIYEQLEILGVLSDFTRRLEALPRRRKLITFFGSTVGNFAEREALALLRKIGGIMGPGDRFLLGLDMIKPVEVLEAAYNDGQGITADFNRNILAHINAKLGSDFDPEDFEHLAFYNRKREQVEMHLCARRMLTARVADLEMSVRLGKGETIQTEICRKFSRESAGRLLRAAGLSVVRWFTDPRDWFALVEVKTPSKIFPPEAAICLI